MFRFRSLGTRIVAFFTALMAALTLSGILIVGAAITDYARGKLQGDLAVGERVLLRLLAQRRDQLAQAAQVLSRDFAFREAIASGDADTVTSALANHGQRIGANLMMLIGLDERVAASTAGPPTRSGLFDYHGLLEHAQQQGSASSVVLAGEQLHQLVVVPVLAPDIIGWVAMGFVMDDALARDLSVLTGLDVSFLAAAEEQAWRFLAGTIPTAAREHLTQALDLVDAQRKPTATFRMGDNEYESRAATLMTGDGTRVIAVLQRSLADALEPFHALRMNLAGLVLIGLIAAIIASFFIGGGIARPLKALARSAKRLEQGDYSEPIPVDHADEIGDLASAFNHMREGIAAREQTIIDLAFRDPVTGLPNRAAFTRALEHELATASSEPRPISLLLINLDQFKYVNDLLGPQLGDRLLCEVGKRLRATLPKPDCNLARIGGDEFTILLPDMTSRQAQEVAAAAQQLLEDPVQLAGHLVDVAASMGIASFPDHGHDVRTLVGRADTAMHIAKAEGRGVYVYDGRQDARPERLSLLTELRHAVENDELLLYFQPKVDVVTGRASSFEALVRWQHPERGLIPPDQFIPFAEQTSYIRVITQWVLRNAVKRCVEWRQAGLNLCLSVNVSARDLVHAELPLLMNEMRRTYSTSLEWLCLEITESAIMGDPVRALQTLEHLSDLGVKLSIDDFGTGYSSLAYLKRLPVDEIKIDKSFVMGLEKDENDRIIVRSTIQLAHSMGLSVVAEGVENETIMQRLANWGCDQMQGYHISRPLSADELQSWLRESRWGLGVPDPVALTEATIPYPRRRPLEATLPVAGSR